MATSRKRACPYGSLQVLVLHNVFLQAPAGMRCCSLAVLLVPLCLAAELTVQPNSDCPMAGSGSGGRSLPCITLDQALQNLTSHSVIVLEDGVHSLDTFTLVSGVENVSLVGHNTSSTVIRCEEAIGLAFLNVSRLTFEDLHILDCGLTDENLEYVVNLTREIVQLNFNVPYAARIALYLANVSDLALVNVSVTNTSGLGIAGINIIGDSRIEDCNFLDNIRAEQQCNFVNQSFLVTDQGERIGGGAYFLFQDFQGTSITDCDLDPKPHYYLGITRSVFAQNSECSILSNTEFNYRDSRRAQRDGYNIGGGGGLTLMFAQVCYGVEVLTKSTLFQNNTAVFGSGAHIGIFQGVSDSSALFDDCQFIKNGFPSTALRDTFTYNGGAIGMYNDLVSPDTTVPLFIHDRNISLHVSNTNFSGNGALSGGAVAITSLVTTAVADLSDVAYFLFDNCTFDSNTATSGAALLIIELKLNARILGIQLFGTDLTVTNNAIVSLESLESISTVDSTAIFDIRAVNFTLRGDCRFESNRGTAMQSTHSLIGIDANVTFINNAGLYGGAMNFNEFAYLIVLPNSNINFLSNIGRIRGGAIYVDQVGNSPLTTTLDCFLYFNYDQFDFCNPCDFTENDFKVRFINNSALSSGGTIYGSALRTCPWAEPLQRDYPNQTVFEVLQEKFPDHFQFEPDPVGVENVQSTIASVSIINDEPVYVLAPGEATNLTVRASDSLNQSISALLGSYISLNDEISTTVFSVLGAGLQVIGNGSNQTVQLRLLGSENITSNLVVYALDIFGRRPVQLERQVRITNCPDGFVFNSTTGSCTCDSNLITGGLQCDVLNSALIVPDGLWVGPIDGSDFGLADCIRGLCEPGTVYLRIINTSVDYDIQCLQGLNRRGLLCSSCIEGYSNVFGSNRCVRCSNTFSAMIILFLFLGIIIILFLVYFQANLSAGLLNGVIFFSNIVSLYERVLIPNVNSSGRLVLASWLSLNWGIETCFHNGMTALERSWWQLSFPLYLVFLMILTRSLFNSKCFKRVGANTAFHTIQALATLIIVCYISILHFCFELLGVVEIYTDEGEKLVRWRVDPTVTYFTGAHGVLAFTACVLIVFYIIPMPLILMFPSALYKFKLFKAYKPIYDAFWNPFKPKYRFWLGFRLIFRWVPFILVFFVTPPTSTFVTGVFLAILLFLQMLLQPFQSFWINVLDSFFLLDLVLLFMGSVFFSAASHDSLRDRQLLAMHRAGTFTSVFVGFAYVGFVIVFLYHIYVRFPKLKECLRKCREHKKVKRVLTVPLNLPEDKNQPVESVEGETTVAGPEAPVKAVSYTTFREPLLDEGSVEIQTYTTLVSLSPSSPSTNSTSPPSY